MNGKLKPFVRSSITMPPFEQFFEDNKRLMPDITEEIARETYDKTAKDEIWVNDEYQVNIDKDAPHGFPEAEIWHLSIKRLSKDVIHDWRDLQEIKNMLVSPHCEAVELYPSEHRKVDTANQYHLWVFVRMGGTRYPMIPVGWTGRLTGTSADVEAMGARQRD